MNVRKYMWCAVALLAGSMLLHMPVSAQGNSATEAYIGKNADDAKKVWFETVEEALNQAHAGDLVFLSRDAELSEDAEVKEGVTLILPAEGKGYTASERNPENPGTVSAPKLEYSMKIPHGVNLEISGTVLVNAVTGLAREGIPTGYDISGAYSQIVLDGTVSVNSGGLLDVYGYVKGSGQVTAQNGGTVRDLMVIQNWRGTDYAIAMCFLNVFPFNEYKLHNIETDIRINSGGTLGGNLRIYFDGEYYTRDFLMVDNENGISRIQAGGYLIKSYRAGRECWDFYGGGVFADSSYKIGSIGLHTSNYFFSLDGQQSINLHSGIYNFKNMYKFMPGAELAVDRDAQMVIEKTGKLVFYTDAFRDAYTKRGTAYPSNRPGAVLRLDGRLTINGGLGGNVIAGLSSRLHIAENAVTTVRVSEGSDLETVIQNAVDLRVSGKISYILPESILLNRQKLELVSGSESILSVQFKPAAVTQKTCRWRSSNTDIVSVDANGKIRSAAPGEAKITVTTQNGKQASVRVTVLPRQVNARYLSNDTVRLSWKKTQGISRYELYRSASASGKYDRIASVSGVKYTDKKVKAGKTYFYKVKVNGIFSKPVRIKVVPDAPEKLRTSSKSGKVVLRWRKADKVKGYRVFRAASQKGRYKRIADVKKTEYTDNNVKRKKTYYYKVKSWKAVKGKRVYSDYSKPAKTKVK